MMTSLTCWSAAVLLVLFAVLVTACAPYFRRTLRVLQPILGACHSALRERGENTVPRSGPAGARPVVGPAQGRPTDWLKGGRRTGR